MNRRSELAGRAAVAAGVAVLLSAGIVAAAPRPLPDASWRLVGPFRAGWATAVAGIEGDATTFYFGAAGGGVWKTTDAGRTSARPRSSRSPWRRAMRA